MAFSYSSAFQIIDSAVLSVTGGFQHQVNHFSIDAGKRDGKSGQSRFGAELTTRREICSPHCLKTKLSGHLWTSYDISARHSRTYIYTRRHGSMVKSWPSTHDVERLVQNASGQFIYAATAVKYIDDEYSLPEERLQAVLESSTVGKAPFQDLVALYHRILASHPNADLVMRVLGAYFSISEYTLRYLNRESIEYRHQDGRNTEQVSVPAVFVLILQRIWGYRYSRMKLETYFETCSDVAKTHAALYAMKLVQYRSQEKRTNPLTTSTSWPFAEEWCSLLGIAPKSAQLIWALDEMTRMGFKAAEEDISYYKIDNLVLWLKEFEPGPMRDRLV
ncbi:putative nwd2 protein [Mycena kentingensis (nom. inval.)]|nr:putative nwd2 protein [Mycena kentingensis (nom. inval.)]